jgi:GntR family carbon starvation induced transcriptional regulator
VKIHSLAADELVGRTLASDVLHRLRADIVEAKLAPGQRLRFEALRSAYGASFSTLREALAHLVGEYLVVAEGQRGFRVAPVSRADLDDLFQTRIFIERELLRRAVANGGPEWDQALLQAHAQLAEASGPTSDRRSAEWQQRHEAFHDALVAPAGSPTLLALRGILNRRSMRYRHWARQLRPNLPATQDGHQPLLEAALARDAPALMAAVEGQIRRTAEVILQYTADQLLVA